MTKQTKVIVVVSIVIGSVVLGLFMSNSLSVQKIDTEKESSTSYKDSTSKVGVNDNNKKNIDNENTVEADIQSKSENPVKITEVESKSNDSIVLKEGEWKRIDISTESFDNNDLTATGLVSEKNCYVNTENQVIYEVILNIGFGSSKQEVKHYCSYSTFSNINVGDNVTVTFNTLKDNPNIFSILNIEITR